MAKKKEETPTMKPEQEIAFHQGAMSTLIAERNELVKMVGNVDAILQMHMKRLEELGVKFEQPKQ